jgi:hypothetical protein
MTGHLLGPPAASNPSSAPWPIRDGVAAADDELHHPRSGLRSGLRAQPGPQSQESAPA